MGSLEVVLVGLALGAALWAAARTRAAAWRSGDFRRLERKLDALSAVLRDYYPEGDGGATAEGPELPDSHGFGDDHQVTRADLRRLERKLDTIVRGLGVQDSLAARIPAGTPALV